MEPIKCYCDCHVHPGAYKTNPCSICEHHNDRGALIGGIRNGHWEPVFTVMLNPKGGYPEGYAKINQIGAHLIWGAYVKLYGNYQTIHQREKRGGIAYTSEIDYYIKKGLLPNDFNWEIYKI